MKFTSYLHLCTFLFLSVLVYGQKTDSEFWTPVTEKSINQSGIKQIIPQKYLSFALTQNNLKSKLVSAPRESSTAIDLSTCIIELPGPNGKILKYKVVESPIMSEELSAAYPDIKTYSLKGVDDVYASGKLDWNEFGFHASIFSAQGDFFIDPYCLGNTKDYLSYYTLDFKKDPKYMTPEFSPEDKDGHKKNYVSPSGSGSKLSGTTAAPVCIGGQLRSYRLAIACTGEYAIAATGSTTPTMAQTLAKIVTSVNRVDGVFEREVGVRMVLVSTETNVIYTNASTDPFNGNNDAGTLISESQTVITSQIGAANYDIGHTFSSGGGGLAYLGVVCTNATKALGITGNGNPVGDPYDIDYVAHELGHQFNSNHSFNAITGSCNGNRTAATAVEPGSGVTIMGYAGICSSNDLAAHSIAYFHAISYDEIVKFTQTGTGNTCAVISSSGNQAPQVTGSGNFIIPHSTPFILEGSGFDPDGDPLTFSWEETDPGINGNNWSSGKAPFFRSYTPVTSASRSFPKTQALLNNNYKEIPGEYLPETAQYLTFRLTARDNKMGGGGVCFSNATISVVDDGPFLVTYPTGPDIAWGNTQTKTITWDVNGTDLVPVNCQTVNILISYDGGNSYSNLVPNTANDGFETIPVPTVTTVIPTCRIRIESKGNIFYDVSKNNFTISTDVTAGVGQNSQVDPLSLNVWPNPFEQHLNFTCSALNSEYPTEVRVVDLISHTVLSFDYKNKTKLKESIDLSTLSDGIYFLMVTNNQSQSIHKIVKN